MQTLSYGFENPENGDRGSVWFPALNHNIEQLNDHDHDGVNSALISGASIAGGSVAILAAAWVSNGTGEYKQDVTCPSGFDMDSFAIEVRITGGNIIHPSIERLTSGTFRIYTLDNTLAYTAVFR